MTKILTAIALTIALPAVAHAGTTPAPTSKANCHEKMKTAALDSSKDMAMMDHSMSGMTGMMAGHGMAQPGAKVPAADALHNHQK